MVRGKVRLIFVQVSSVNRKRKAECDWLGNSVNIRSRLLDKANELLGIESAAGWN